MTTRHSESWFVFVRRFAPANISRHTKLSCGCRGAHHADQLQFQRWPQSCPCAELVESDKTSTSLWAQMVRSSRFRWIARSRPGAGSDFLHSRRVSDLNNPPNNAGIHLKILDHPYTYSKVTSIRQLKAWMSVQRSRRVSISSFCHLDFLFLIFKTKQKPTHRKKNLCEGVNLVPPQLWAKYRLPPYLCLKSTTSCCCKVCSPIFVASNSFLHQPTS